VDRSSAGAPRGVGCVEGVRFPACEMVWGGALLYDLKMEHFGAVFKLDLTEETRMQLQEEEAISSSCLVLVTPMDTSCCRSLLQ